MQEEVLCIWQDASITLHWNFYLLLITLSFLEECTVKQKLTLELDKKWPSGNHRANFNLEKCPHRWNTCLYSLVWNDKEMAVLTDITRDRFLNVINKDTPPHRCTQIPTSKRVDLIFPLSLTTTLWFIKISKPR